jgi:hypothetical protein
MLESPEIFFGLERLSLSFEVESITLELQYVENSPLFTVEAQSINGRVTSMAEGIRMQLKMFDLIMKSYNQNEARRMFSAQKKPGEHIISTNCLIPKDELPSRLEATVNSISIVMDTDAMKGISEFFRIGNRRMQAVKEEIHVVRYDLGESLQGISALKNFVIPLVVTSINYQFPFVDRDEKHLLQLSLSTVHLSKPCQQLISPKLEQYSIEFKMGFSLDLVAINDSTLAKLDTSNAAVALGFTRGQFFENINAGKVTSS